MSKKNVSAEETMRRVRTALVKEAARATITAYLDLINTAGKHALQMLETLDPYTQGEPLPRLGRKFGRVLNDLAATKKRGDHEGYENATSDLCDLLDPPKLVSLFESVVLETFTQAAAKGDTPIEVSLHRIREAIDSRSPSDNYMTSVEAAFRKVVGGTVSHRRLFGEHDATDRTVIASYSQHFTLDQDSDQVVGHA